MQRSVTASHRLLLNMHACVCFVCLFNSWSLCGVEKKNLYKVQHMVGGERAQRYYSPTRYILHQTCPTDQANMSTHLIHRTDFVSIRFLVDLTCLHQQIQEERGRMPKKVCVCASVHIEISSAQTHRINCKIVFV